MLSGEALRILSQQAEEAAMAAGHYIQSQFNQLHQVHQKKGGASIASQVVTAVDIKAQEIILQHLQSTFKLYDFGLLTEEATDDQSRLKKPYFWCIDPLDGTLAFTEGRTGYAVSIALVTQAGDSIIGVVNVPDLENSYSAIKGEEVFLNNKPLILSDEVHDESVHFYMDSSLQQATYYEWLKLQLEAWAEDRKLTIQTYNTFGAVRNALGVLHSPLGAYFKYPKEKQGGGSIWDYAATRLFFEELGLRVSNSNGNKLHLNKPNTSFMHQQGVLFATDQSLSDFIKSMLKSIM